MPDVLQALKELERKLDTHQAPRAIEHTPALRRPPEPIQSTPAIEQTPVTEQAFEQYKQVDEQHPEESPYVIKSASKTRKDQVMTDDANKSDTVIAIEEILADNLGEVYQRMSPAEQEQFKQKGEEVARTIADMTTKLKATAKKILQLIREWLQLIPGVSKYFLEQEAKIKTDELLNYTRKHLKLQRDK
ncbi:MAG: hypothetical protein HYV33_06550 [Candidatus Kerfeldbacteria bacterium]|nr:hypothetical protein [Candidatus Kerfeldbacteria bacterium]